MRMVEALVFDLGWDPNVVSAMQFEEVAHWFETAVRRKKEREGGGS